MAAPVSLASPQEPLTMLPPELRPSVEHLVTEDDTPVDSVYSEKQMRLLTRPLYSSWTGPDGDGLFLALANVGMFFAVDQPPLVPDVLLSLGVKVPTDMRPKRHRSYFFWEYGKPPDTVVEVVSNQEGGELDTKKAQYARLGITYYVVWDPLKLIGETPLEVFGLRLKTYESVSPTWLEGIGLGLVVWHGTFEKLKADWLRWCDREGNVIPLGEERAAVADQRAEQADQRAEQALHQAEQAQQQAEEARQRAELAEQRAERLAAQLRQHGLEPGNGKE